MSKFTVYTVTPDFFGYVRELFADIAETKILPKNYDTLEDFNPSLIVFTGGEDINPRTYRYPSEGGYNDERDAWELIVFKDILVGNLKCGKVLGICRGMQLLNVGFGGSLVQDIFSTYGKSHPSIHGLKHYNQPYITNPFAFLEKTNSMHHQAISSPGTKYKIFPYFVWAREPSTELPEIASWGDKYLGFQFHPEFFQEDNPFKKKIVEVIDGWLASKIRFIGAGVKTGYEERGTKRVDVSLNAGEPWDTSTLRPHHYSVGINAPIDTEQWFVSPVNNEREENN
jgi:putative glutamine amidotransferase